MAPHKATNKAPFPPAIVGLSRATFDYLFNSQPIPILIASFESRKIVALNIAANIHFGDASGLICGVSVVDLIPGIESGNLDALLAPGAPESVVWKGQQFRNGTLTEVALEARLATFENGPAALIALNDATGPEMDAAWLGNVADMRDGLTGLPNRLAFTAKLDEIAASYATEQRLGALIVVGIDRFRSVNETLGNLVGNYILKEVAQRLREASPRDVTVARIGGDEFGVVIRTVEDDAEAISVARRIQKAISAPFLVNERLVEITASIGFGLTPDDGETSDDILQSALLALETAKAEGAGRVKRCAPGLIATTRELRRLEQDLTRAIEDGDIEVFYQPIMSVRTGHLTGAEALVRWRHPTRGYVSPAEFIPITEKLELIEKLGEQVLLRACREARTWPDQIAVAVNISTLQFETGRLPETVRYVLGVTDLPASRLELEITESVLIQRPNIAIQTLQELRDLGVKIALDDFGTGYSSLGYVCNLPFDKLKIDRSFVRDIVSAPNQQAVVLALTTLGQSLGKIVVAEGVETAADLDCLSAAGCDQWQGFLLSKPCPLSELMEMISVLAPRPD